jgi:plasmid stabilization system protein ParE
MNRPVRFHHAAEIDYYESIVWYEKRQAGLGERFRQAINQVLHHVTENPERFPRTRFRTGDAVLQRVMVRGFPFVIYFLSRSDEIVIIAVFHTSRDPHQLRDRINPV